jgi:hypothetical protein
MALCIAVNGELFCKFQIDVWLSILVLSVKGKNKFVSVFYLDYMLSDLVSEII